MLSRSKAALIFSALLLFNFHQRASGEVIGKVIWSGNRALSAEELSAGSLLIKGAEYTDSIVSLEKGRLDSLYFNEGYLSARISMDSLSDTDGVDITVEVQEGSRAVIGNVNVSGDRSLLGEGPEGFGALERGRAFKPSELSSVMESVLGLYNSSGYPFAQVWITGFTYRDEINQVDLSFSVVSGEEAVISDILFKGLAKTDTSTAVTASRFKKGVRYSEKLLGRTVDHIEASSIFDSVGEPEVVRSGEKEVVVVIPVEERKNSNFFQGAFGFSRKEDNEYEINGYFDLILNNLAGTGRNAGFSWLNDGKKYSKTEISYYEPFLFSSPAALSLSLRQVVQDSLYNMTSGGLEFKIPFGPPGLRAAVGASYDRNAPGFETSLLRSVRQRYRLGIEKVSGSYIRFRSYMEGARKKNYLRNSEDETLWQYIYLFEFDSEIPTLLNQSFYFRLHSEGAFSGGEISLAEMYPLGGARTLRGYRENQFRGERVSYVNIEYRFGDESRLFIFDDIGAYYREDENWKLKNGFGFGIRSVSAIGTVELSFGVAEKISLDGTRIHVSLIETF